MFGQGELVLHVVSASTAEADSACTKLCAVVHPVS